MDWAYWDSRAVLAQQLAIMPVWKWPMVLLFCDVHNRQTQDWTYYSDCMLIIERQAIQCRDITDTAGTHWHAKVSNWVIVTIIIRSGSPPVFLACSYHCYIIQLFTILEGSQTPWEHVIIGCFGYVCHVPSHQGPILCFDVTGDCHFGEHVILNIILIM